MRKGDLLSGVAVFATLAAVALIEAKPPRRMREKKAKKKAGSSTSGSSHVTLASASSRSLVSTASVLSGGRAPASLPTTPLNAPLR
ncbi:hypothetical protein DIPPA_14739 [Diplonema papillatum]|nr:hypothetical protein DIPPA_14739 [Diplonema papillatum]